MAMFIKGQEPWNKGTKGIMKPNSGSFTKGTIPHNKKEHINKICPSCNKEFNVKPSLSRITYCSRSCVLKGKPSLNKGKKASSETRLKQRIAKLGIRGEKHWNYKGHKNKDERDLAMSRDEYKQWRNKVFERDNYTCQICNIKGGYLEADHIKPWSLYPEFRYNLNNGRTLCRSCHIKTETWGSRIKNIVQVGG